MNLVRVEIHLLKLTGAEISYDHNDYNYYSYSHSGNKENDIVFLITD